MQPMWAMKVVLLRTLKVLRKVEEWKKNLRVDRSSGRIIVLALDILVKAIDKAGYSGKIKIGMDVAASEFFDEQAKKYDLNNKEKGRPNYVSDHRWSRIMVEIDLMWFSWRVKRWLRIIWNKSNNIQSFPLKMVSNKMIGLVFNPC